MHGCSTQYAIEEGSGIRWRRRIFSASGKGQGDLLPELIVHGKYQGAMQRVESKRLDETQRHACAERLR